MSAVLFLYCLVPVIRLVDFTMGPSVTLCSVADDIATVLSDVWAQLPRVWTRFLLLEEVAGLEANARKVVCIPLNRGGIRLFEAMLRAMGGRLPEFRVAYSGVYLGVSMGPDSAGDRWNTALTKYRAGFA